MRPMSGESHIRIDEGVKRGPRKRNGIPTRPSAKQDLGTWQIPKDLNPDDVLNRYLTEQTTSQIAQQYGLSRKALTKWLRQQRPEEWKQAQIIRALAIKEDSEEGLQGAVDALSLARARELLKSAQFDLQALDNDYRPRQDVQITGTVTISHALQSISAARLGASLGAPEPKTIEHDEQDQ